MSIERVDADRVIALLSAARSQDGLAGVAFDADGTLWSGDVGEDVFETATERGLLRDDGAEELGGIANRYRLDTSGTPSEIARRLYTAYREGHVPELLMCEIMTWAYAGYTFSELRELARDVFAERKLATRVRRALSPIMDWARTEGVRVVVVSASPRVLVAEGLSAAGITVADLAGAETERDGETIRPKLSAPVPYAGQKRVYGEQLLAGRQWLASFGDSVFDMEMLRTARVGVAVFPKPALAARLDELDNAVLFE